MILLLDIGNTHTHVGLATARRVTRCWDMPTEHWFDARAERALKARLKGARVDGAVLCSVVPRAVQPAGAVLKRWMATAPFILDASTIPGLGIDYPRPHTIGPDRLANALAAKVRYGAPVVVVDFGTAVTFDVVSRRGEYVGGIIAPGLAAMTDYLHEKTALLPRIRIRDSRAVIGKNTEQAMRIGAVHGYRGLVRELVGQLKTELRCRRLPVVATGGYARLMASGLGEITAVDPKLTLEGLRLAWMGRDEGC